MPAALRLIRNAIPAAGPSPSRLPQIINKAPGRSLPGRGLFVCEKNVRLPAGHRRLRCMRRTWCSYSSRSHRPVLPPSFFSRRTSLISMPRSTALHMS